MCDERKMNKEIEQIITNLRDISKSIEDKHVLVTGEAGFFGLLVV